MPGLTEFTPHETSRHAAAGAIHEENPLCVEVEHRPDGIIAAKQEQVGTRSDSWEYRYDKDGRLEQAVLNGTVVEAYEYGPHGKRMRDATMATGMAWRSLAYDRRGQLIRAGRTLYQYNASGQLCAVRNPRGITHMRYDESGGLLGLWHRNGLVLDYRTDHMGRPVEKIQNDRVIERFHWLDELRLAAWEDMDNGVYMEFSYDEAHCQGRVPLKARWHAQGRGATYLLGADQVGTAKVVADMHGQVIQHITYDSFGNVLRQDGNDLFLPIGLSGGVLDRHTGFVRFGYRDYDPTTGRFTAPDPLGDTGGDHDPWEYCVDDPVNAIDPWGLKRQTADGRSQLAAANDEPQVNEKGEYWTVETQPGSCKACQEMAKKTYAAEPERPHLNCKCKYTKHEVPISWTFNGTTLSQSGGGSWESKSGPHGKGALPAGIYRIGGIAPKTPEDKKGAFCDPTKHCWACGIEPLFETKPKRTRLAIHPDGNVDGTEGCIGISPKHEVTSDLRQALANKGEMRRFLVIFLVLLVAASMPLPCSANNDCTKRIKDFLYVLENKPTLASCERMVMDESELILEHIICEERGWVPKGSREIYPKCVEFTNKRAKNANNPCLYLMWLRSKIPTKPTTFRILKSEYKKQYLTHHVTVLLDSVSVEFAIPDPDTYGDIDVRSINGEYVFDILRRDVEKGFSPSIYLEDSKKE